MQTSEYLSLVEKEIKNLGNFESIKDDIEIIQVWYCKTIQNHKGLFIIHNTKTNTVYDYFIEATYNGDMKELYLDIYVKQNKRISKC